MTFIPCTFDFRVAAGYLFMCMMLLLHGCSQSFRPDGTLKSSATMSYEDRQMMRHYLVQKVQDRIADIARMQAQIDLDHDYE